MLATSLIVLLSLYGFGHLAPHIVNLSAFQPLSIPFEPVLRQNTLTPAVSVDEFLSLQQKARADKHNDVTGPLAVEKECSRGLKNANILVRGPAVKGCEEFLSDGGRISPRVPGEEWIYTSAFNGSILRFRLRESATPSERAHLAQTTLREVAFTNGRPLGITWGPEAQRRDMYVADATVGLLRIKGLWADEIDPLQIEISILANRDAIGPFKYTNAVEIVEDGASVVFSVSSSKWAPPTGYVDSLVEGKPDGRVLKLNLVTGELTTLLSGLYFANGVALSADKSFLVVSETYGVRVWKVYLSGSKLGQAEVLMSNVPCYVDNLASNGNGTIWAGCGSPRLGFLERAVANIPGVASAIRSFPLWLQPKPKPIGLIFAFSEADGTILHCASDDSGTLRAVAAARPVGNKGRILLGSFISEFVAEVSY